MQEYNSPEEYIKDVQRYIRWSRAKVVATRELSDHINDQYDALRENGLNQKEAMRKAIEEMGDADVVGTELDIVHRPKVNWLLLLIAGVLLLSGILISAMLTSISLTVPKIIGIVLGVCVAAFLYFIDYTVLIRFPRALYGLLSLAAIFGLLYELWNGFAPLGYGFLFYLLLISICMPPCMGKTIAAVFLRLSAASVKGFLSWLLLSALLLQLSEPVSDALLFGRSWRSALLFHLTLPFGTCK